MPVNPVDNRGYYLNILVGGRPFPGQIVKGGIRGLGNTEEWTIVRAIAGTGWVQNHKGRKPIEGIEVEVSLDGPNPDAVRAAWQAHYAFVVFIRGAAPPKYSKPKALQITGTPFRGAGVNALVYASHVEPVFDTGSNRVVYKFNEHTKSIPIPIGPPEPAILNETDPTPKTEQEIALRDAVVATRGADGPPPPVSEISSRYPGVGAVGVAP